MSIGILGKKLGMSQFFDDEGRSIPVTVIEAGPCRITQLKTDSTDGYTAVQLGFGDIREKLVNKPAKGHLAKSGSEPLRHLKEYRVDSVDGLELGSAITVAAFEAGQKVDVSGDTIGRGFSGYQKRHGFSYAVIQTAFFTDIFVVQIQENRIGFIKQFIIRLAV